MGGPCRTPKPALSQKEIPISDSCGSHPYRHLNRKQRRSRLGRFASRTGMTAIAGVVGLGLTTHYYSRQDIEADLAFEAKLSNWPRLT